MESIKTIPLPVCPINEAQSFSLVFYPKESKKQFYAQAVQYEMGRRKLGSGFSKELQKTAYDHFLSVSPMFDLFRRR